MAELVNTSPVRPSQFQGVSGGGAGGSGFVPGPDLSGATNLIAELINPGWRERKALEMQKKGLANQTADAVDRAKKLGEVQKDLAKAVHEQNLKLMEDSTPTLLRVARARAAGESASRLQANQNVMDFLAMQRDQQINDQELASSVEEARTRYYSEQAMRRQQQMRNAPLIYQAVTGLPMLSKSDPQVAGALNTLFRYNNYDLSPAEQMEIMKGGLRATSQPSSTQTTPSSDSTSKSFFDSSLGRSGPGFGAYIPGAASATETLGAAASGIGEFIKTGFFEKNPALSMSVNGTDITTPSPVTDYTFSVQPSREDAQKAIAELLPRILPTFQKRPTSLDALSKLLTAGNDDEVREVWKGIPAAEAEVLASDLDLATTTLYSMAQGNRDKTLQFIRAELGDNAALGKLVDGQAELEQVLAEVFPDPRAQAGYKRTFAYLADQMSRVVAAVRSSTDGSAGHTIDMMSKRYKAAVLSGAEAVQAGASSYYEGATLGEALGENMARAYMDAVRAGTEPRAYQQFLSDSLKTAPNFQKYFQRGIQQGIVAAGQAFSQGTAEDKAALAQAGITPETLQGLIESMPRVGGDAPGQDWVREATQALRTAEQTGDWSVMEPYFIIAGEGPTASITPAREGQSLMGEFQRDLGPQAGAQQFNLVQSKLNEAFALRNGTPYESLLQQMLAYEKAKLAPGVEAPSQAPGKAAPVGPPAPTMLERKMADEQSKVDSATAAENAALEQTRSELQAGQVGPPSPEPEQPPPTTSSIQADPVKGRNRVYSTANRREDAFTKFQQNYQATKQSFQASVAPPPQQEPIAPQQMAAGGKPKQGGSPQGQGGPKLVQPNLNMATAMQAPPVL